MDDKVWINTHAYAHGSLLTPVTTVIKGPYYISILADRGVTFSLAFLQTAHHLHPPGVGHLLLSLCPTGDLGEKAALLP